MVVYQQDQSVSAGDKWKFGDVGGNFRPYVISQQSGSYQSIPDFLDSSHKVANAEDAEAYLSRLSAFSTVMDNDLARQKHDVALGAIPATFICDLSIGQMKALRDQPAGQTILDALLEAGISANYACTEGVCGTCETRVIEGNPDHRDLFLSKEEQEANKTIMICCSGSKSVTLVLDI